jgi:hypothetical protein
MEMIPKEPAATAGIRVFTKGAIVAPHTVVSPDVSFKAIVVVEQNTHEDWPVELYNRDGLAQNITLSPGSVLLLESGNVVHGRPFPLKGKYHATISYNFIGNEFSTDYVPSDNLYSEEPAEEVRDEKNSS